MWGIETDGPLNSVKQKKLSLGADDRIGLEGGWNQISTE